VTNTGSWTVQPWQTAGSTKTFRQPAAPPSTHSLGIRTPSPSPWLFAGKTPTNGKAAEVIVESFTFTPLDQQMDWAPVSPARVGG
jgi:hypothetical protein